MATDFKKISDLPAATSLSGDELVPVVHGGVTRRATVAQIFPTGFMAPYAGVGLEEGWLDCDASALSETSFSRLWGKLHSVVGVTTVTIASPGVFTLNSHGRSTGDRVFLTTTGALPTGLSAHTTYYLINVTSSTFRLATSLANALAGTAINTSGSQSGVHTLVYAPWGVSGTSDFLLPESAEVSFIGIGTRASGVSAHDTYVLAQFKENALQDHEHVTEGTTGGGQTGIQVVSNVQLSGSNFGIRQVRAMASSSLGGTPRPAAVTRGNGVGVRWMIKW